MVFHSSLVVATYDKVRLHIDKFDSLPFSCIFLDEAHKIKNPEAKITREYNKFACQVRFGLTVRFISTPKHWELCATSFFDFIKLGGI
jgi:superfamily II DNA or RNA helicase